MDFIGGPPDILELGWIEHPGEKFERSDHARTVPARQLSVNQKHAIRVDGRQRRPARASRQVVHVTFDLWNGTPARRHDEHLGVNRSHVVPRDPPAVFARDTEAGCGVQSGDDLWDPEPVRTEWIGPLETDHARWGWLGRDAFGDGVDAGVKRSAKRTGTCCVAQRGTDAVDRIEDIVDGTRTHRHQLGFRIEAFHRGDRHALRNCTDVTQSLGNQYVRFHRGEGILPHAECGVFPMPMVVDGVIDAGRITRRFGIDGTLGDDGQLLDRRRMITPVGSADECIDRADAGNNLGRTRQEGNGTHAVDPVSNVGTQKHVRTNTAVTFDVFETLVTMADPPDPAAAIREALVRRGVTVPADWAAAYGEVHVPVPDGRERPLAEHVRHALSSRGVTVAPELVTDAVFEAFAILVTRREGATSAVRTAKAVGPVGFLSNCSVPGLVEHALAAAAVPPVEVVVTSVECGYRKPDVRAFEAAADALGVRIDQLVHVGDDPHADGGATAHGATAVLVDDVPLRELPTYLAGIR